MAVRWHHSSKAGMHINSHINYLHHETFYCLCLHVSKIIDSEKCCKLENTGGFLSVCSFYCVFCLCLQPKNALNGVSGAWLGFENYPRDPKERGFANERGLDLCSLSCLGM